MPQEVKSIYEKLALIQNELLAIPIAKSGKNKFGGFDYYELEDLIPPVIKLCIKYGCTPIFSFPTGKGVLKLVNWEDKEDVICIEVPFAELEKLPKMNYAQSSGTYQTYMKRYLLLHMFQFCEGEIIDATNHEETNSVNFVKKPSTPKIVLKVQQRCKELYPDRECDKQLLNKVSMKMFKDKEITKEERGEIYKFVKSK